MCGLYNTTKTALDWFGCKMECNAQISMLRSDSAPFMTSIECFGHLNDCLEEYDLKYYCFESYSPKYDCWESISPKKWLLWISVLFGSIRESYGPKITVERKMVENITALERLDQKNTAMNWSGSKRESYCPKYKCCGVIWPQKRVLFI